MNASPQTGEVLICRHCAQQKHRQGGSTLELKSIRTVVEQTLEEKSKKLKDRNGAEWDEVSL